MIAGDAAHETDYSRNLRQMAAEDERNNPDLEYGRKKVDRHSFHSASNVSENADSDSISEMSEGSGELVHNGRNDLNIF